MSDISRKVTYLFRNTAILFISNFASKIASFILLPFLTAALSPSDYGISNLITSFVNLASPVLTLGISDVVMRFLLDRTTDRDELLCSGAALTFASTAFLSLAAFCVRDVQGLSPYMPYIFLCVVLYFFYSANSLLSQYEKGLENVRLMGLAGIAATAVYFCSCIFLVVILDWGTRGLLLSHILMLCASTLIYIFCGNAKKCRRFALPAISTQKKMAGYGIPNLFSEICWWINTAADQYVVLWLLGPAASGLLSAAQRIPTMLTVFTSIFISAWKLSAAKEYESDKEEFREFFSRMIEFYDSLLLSVGAFFILISPVCCKFLLRGAFDASFPMVPLYILSFVINGIPSFSAGMFLAQMRPLEMSYATAAGTAVNLVLDYILIRLLGTIGAPIATCAAYFVILLIRLYQMRTIMRIRMNYSRILSSYILITVQTFVMRMELNSGIYLSGFLLALIILVNRKAVLTVIRGITRYSRTIWRRVFARK